MNNLVGQEDERRPEYGVHVFVCVCVPVRDVG